MEYETLKDDIEEDIAKLAKKIEKFCVLENKRYTTTYKNKLREIHRLFEDLN